MRKRVLDVACGSKMFYFDKENQDVEFCDKREIERHEYYPGRFIEVKPDTVCDFTALPFEDGSYNLVIFDPPHLKRAGAKSWSAMKYGVLTGDWKETIKKGFEECFRVLDTDGVLIFKWSEVQIPLSEILPLSPYPPIFGNRGGKSFGTHWLCFMKPSDGRSVADERDAALRDLTEIMVRGGANIDTCRYCTNEKCLARGGHYSCSPQWRGPQKEEI